MSEAERIRDVFKSSPNRWKTPRALAKETGLSLEVVTRALDRSPEFVRAKKNSKTGEPLFAHSVKIPRVKTAQPTEASAPSRKLEVLVILPFDPSSKRLRDTMQRVLEAQHCTAVFLDQVAAGASWVDGLLRLITASDAVVADITRYNPNVMFEVGMAHGLSRPVILLLGEDEGKSLPTDLLGFQCLTYSGRDLSPFRERLERLIQQLSKQLGGHR